MTNIIINQAKRTIEMSKGFSKEASKFGSKEYKMLREAKKDFPNFKVVTKTTKRNKDGFKGLTFKYMEEYIKEHRIIPKSETEETTDLLIEFYEMCGRDENGNKIEFSKCSAYGTVKKWFLEQYPVFNKYKKHNLKETA